MQVRGYPLRLPLDLLLVATANPEDYTNRGRIITPLKDRFGAEIRTHYPLDVDDEVALVAQEAELVAEVPEHLLEVRRPVRPRAARVAGRRPAVRGVGPARRRRGRDVPPARRCAGPRSPARSTRSPGSATSGRRADAARQGRVRDGRGGPRERGARPPAAARRRRHVPGPAAGARPDRLHRAGRRGRHRRDRRARDRRGAARPARHACRAWPRCSTGSASTRTASHPARSPPGSSSCSRGCT